MSLAASDPIRILHVDDEPEFAELTATFLERESDRFVVETATSVDEASERLDEGPGIDCVVSDFDMPGTDGIEFLRAVREDRPELPFVLFTGKGSEEVASEAISAGVTDYLQKEAGTEQYTVLANRIENAVDRHRAERLVDRAFGAMDSSREGIALLDEDGQFVYVNRAYTEIVGYDAAELVGGSWELVYPEDQVERIYEEILPSVPREGHWNGETVYQRKDGERIVVDHALAYSEQGTMICLLREMADGDVTDRLLREERQRFERFVDAVEDYAIYTLDPDGYVVSWNAGAEQIEGYAEAEILGAHVSTFYTEAQREAGLPEQLLERALAAGSVEHEGLRVRKDGSAFDADVVITAVYDDDGTHRGFVEVTRDVTERRERRREEDREYRRRLYQRAADPSTSGTERIEGLLEIGRERLDVENGHVVRIDREADRHEVIAASGSDLTESGAVTPLSETFCRETIESDGVLAVGDAETGGWGDDPAYRRWGISCYLGGRLQVDGEPFGTVCFADRTPRTEPFTERERSFVDLIARCVAQILERQSHRSDRRLKQRAIDAAPIGISLADVTREDDPLVYVNAEFEALTGYAEDEVRGENCRFLQGEATDPGPVAEMRRAIADREQTTVELRNYRKDGTEFWNRVSLAPIENEDGEVTHFVGFQQDVSESRTREIAIESLHDATRESIAAGSKAEIARTVRDAAVDLLGLAHTGVHLHDEERDVLVPAAWTGTVEERIGEPPTLGRDSLAWAAFESGETGTYSDLEAASDLHNPETPLGSELIVPMGRHGVALAASAERNAFDRDDRRLLELLCANATAAMNRVGREEMLREREQDLERRNEQLQEFTSVVSHDLRNPLNIAAGRVDLASEECDSEHLEGAATGLDRMETLIEDLLALAQEGEDATDPEPVALGPLVEECWRTVDTEPATLVVDTDRTIRADRSRLRQLLENLIRNAVAHGGDGVTITVGDIGTDVDAGAGSDADIGEPGTARHGFYVADDGPGIPAEERERVFESGYSTAEEGTGFGLAIVREIAQAHGWEIRATESATGGARFEVTGVDLVGAERETS